MSTQGSFIDFNYVLPFCHLSVEDFQLALYEQQNGIIRYDPDRLASLKFNPLLSENATNRLSLCDYNDPDANFFELLKDFKCEYYIEDKFNDDVANLYTEKQLSLLHLNTRSLSGNFDKVTTLLSAIKFNFSIIGISETWLTDSFHFCDIPGYNLIHEHRKGRTWGGIGLYLKRDIEFIPRPDLCFSNNSAESVFVEIIRKET